MTIASQTSRIAYTGNSSTTAFAVPFYFAANADLVVYLQDTLGNQTPQVLGTNYNLSGATLTAGGTCTFVTAPTTGYLISIYRDPAVTQTTSYNNNDPFPARSHELALDKLTTIDQRLKDQISRAIHQTEGEATMTTALLSPASRKNKLFGFGTNGELIYPLGPTFVSGTAVGVVEVDSRATGQITTIPISTNIIQTNGYATPGDGGGARFLRSVGPAAANKFQSGDGAWWILAETTATLQMFGAVADGVTDNTTAIQAALNSGISAIHITKGSFVTGPITIPTTIKAIKGASMGASTLIIKRGSYAVSAPMITINAASSLDINSFTVDTNDASFNSTYTFSITNSSFVNVKDIQNTGGGYFIFMSGDTDVNIEHLRLTGTNGGYIAAIYGTGSNDVTVNDVRINGVNSYGVGLAGRFNIIKNSRAYASANFGFYLFSATDSSIIDCYALDTVHEAFQLTDTNYCTISGCTGEWTTAGIDMGSSVNGVTNGSGRMNKITGNTYINSYQAGVGVAGWAQGNLISNNLLRDCGVRQNVSALVAFIDGSTPGAAMSVNTFAYNQVRCETATIPWLVQENKIGGTTIVGNVYKDNQYLGVTAPYLFVVGGGAEFFDLEWRDYTMGTVASTTGTITSYTVNKSSYRERGRTVEVFIDIAITAVGTGAGGLTVSLPFLPELGGGSLAGRENVITGQAFAANLSSQFPQLWSATATSILATGSRIVVSGIYRKALP